jgi:ribonuclease VapC
VILDSSPLVAILAGEPDAELYIQAISRAPRCRMSAGNFIELSIVIESQFPVEVLRQCDALFRRVGIVIEPVTVEQAHLARQAFHDFGKGRHPAGLNFGDCFAYALAKHAGEPLLFKGDDFSRTDVVSAL